MKYVARVKKVIHPGIHKIGVIRDGGVEPVATMPSPSQVEIDLEGTPDQPCFLIRFNDAGDFAGDTWHENLEGAFAQAASSMDSPKRTSALSAMMRSEGLTTQCSRRGPAARAADRSR
jgi:hypothetical protein